MIVRAGFAPRALDLTPEQAQAHWAGTHGGLAARLPGLRRYVQHHMVLRGGRPLLPHPGFDIFAETEFDSVEAMEAAFESPLYQGQIVDDEANLIRRDRFSMALLHRHVVVDADPAEDAVKLLTLMRAHPARPREAFLEALRGPYAEAVRALRPLRHEQLVSFNERAAFDVSDELWFADAEAALAFVNSGATDDALQHVAGLMLGREHVIARLVLIAGPRLPT